MLRGHGIVSWYGGMPHCHGIMPRYSGRLRLGSRLGLEAVIVFDSKSENRDRAVEAVGVSVRA